jgi:hypothetical protein
VAIKGFVGFMEFVGLKGGARASGLLWVIIFSIAFSLAPAACSRLPAHELVLNDFEADSDLDRIHWQCRTLFSLSQEHVTSGKQSLKMELFPADYPGLALKLDKRDWSRYALVALDIYNPQDETLEITVRIDDRPDYPNYEDRYNGRHTLLPGNNRLCIPLSSLRTSGSGRPLSLKAIRRFMLFLVHPHQAFSFYVDNIRLGS